MSDFSCECRTCCTKPAKDCPCEGDSTEWEKLYEKVTDRDKQSIINKSHRTDEVIIAESEHLYLVWDKEL